VDLVPFEESIDVGDWPTASLCDSPGTADNLLIDFEQVPQSSPIGAEIHQQAVFGDSGEFRITVSGSDVESVQTYFNNARICAEILPIEALNEDAITFQTAPESYLLASVMGFTQTSTPAELARFDLREGATLSDLLGDFGVDAETVLDNAMDRMDSDGVITDLQAARDVLEFRLNEADAPALTAAAFDSDLVGDEVVLNDMSADPSTLAVTLEFIGEPLEDPTIIAYAIDPPIGNTTHYYRAKCTTTARASVATGVGRVQLELYRTGPYASQGVRAASAGDSTGYIVGNANNSTTFDTRVKGLKSSNVYTIYGYWVLGGGGYC
jgi:hypothetical protein